MLFLNPLMLLGLLGVSVPIVIHLINRFRPRRLEWGAMSLLRRAMISRSRQVRLEDLILLILRCLAFALLALAMARPTLTGGAAQIAGRTQVAAVIGLDGSMSMGHRPGIESRFDQGVTRVRQVLDTLDVGSPLTLVLLGQQPRVLHQGRYDPLAVSAILDQLKPSAEALNLDLAVEALTSELEELEAGTRELYLVTDTQARHFSTISDSVRSQLADVSQRYGVMLIGVADDRHENLSVDSLSFAAGALRVGATARFSATVHNTGTQPRFGVHVQLHHDQTPISAAMIDELPPGQSRDVSFLVPLREAGIHRLSAVLESDDLTADDVCYAAFNVRDRVNVQVVSGRSAPRWFDDAGGYVLRALQPRDDMTPGTTLRVNLVDWQSRGWDLLEDVDVMVLADVPDLTESQVKALRSFVTDGGGLVLIAGPQVESLLFNARMTSEATPLSPARLGERPEPKPAGDPDEEGIRIRVAAAAHDLVRPLASLSQDLMDEARVKRHVKAEPLESAQVLLRLDDEHESPLLIVRNLGLGRVVLLTASADRLGGDLVIHPLWPILWQQIVSVMTQPVMPKATVAQPLMVVLDSRYDDEQVRFEGPGEQQVVLTPQAIDGQVVAEMPAPMWAGFYELAEVQPTDADPNSPLLAVAAVNVDTGESAVRSMDMAALAEVMPMLRDRLVGPGDDLAAAILRTRVGSELWWLLLVLALAVLLLEATLARRFTQRMVATDSDETASTRPWTATRWRGGRQTTPASAA